MSEICKGKEHRMKPLDRRNFLKNTGSVAATVAAGPIVKTTWGRNASPNGTVRMAVIGIRGRGQTHCAEWSKIANVEVATLCDIDEREFPAALKRMEKLSAKKPKTEVDLRRVLDDKDIDAVSIAAPDHWHALATILACQAGKDVYVEKPTSHNIWEGRKMVEAARKYNRIVQAGMQNRSNKNIREAMKFLHEGGIGDVYMAKALCFKPRDSIGRKQNALAM